MAQDFHDSLPAPSASRLQALVQQSQALALEHLEAQLAAWLGSVDNVLLDFAEQAESSMVQTRFFEALGLIRADRAGITSRYRAALQAGFQHFGQPLDTELADRSRREAHGFSLIAPDDMDETLTEETLVANARNTHFAALYALGQRFAVLNHGYPLAEERLPASPHHLLRAFRATLIPLALDSKVKLVLYALYDRCVMRQLQGLYDKLNEQLKTAGIFPHLKPTVMSNAAGAASKRTTATRPLPLDPVLPPIATEPPTGNTDAERPLDAALFNSILGLLFARRAATGGQPSTPFLGAASVQTLQADVDRVEQVFPTADPGVFSDPAEVPRLVIDASLLGQIKRTITSKQDQLLAQAAAEQARPLDLDTIELVGLLFEYMLNDPLLPNLAKALLSHLHTPYLKLALGDTQLLVDSDHPARLLLDLLVEAGSQWVYENELQRGIFPAMQAVVERVVRPPGGVPVAFPQLLTDFQAEMATQQRRREVIEQRAQAAAQGREKLQLAKQRAFQAIQTQIADVRLPPAVRRFLMQIWTDRLVFILLRHTGEHTPRGWEPALQLAAAVVLLFDGRKPLTEDIDALGQRLYRTIASAVSSLGDYQPAYLAELFQCLQNPQAIRDWRQASVTAATVPPPVATPPAVALTAAEQALLERLRNAALGTQLDLQDGGGNWRRLKLSWLSPVTVGCLFVDRAGAQTDLTSLVELARALIAGRARWVSEPYYPFVQRTLLRIKQALQRSMEATG